MPLVSGALAWGPPSSNEFKRKMSALSVTDVPEEILATKAGGGGASPLPRLRAFLGSHLLGVQARSGSPVRDVSQPAFDGAMHADAGASSGVDFPRDAPYSGRVSAEIPDDARFKATDTLQDGNIGEAHDVAMGDLSGSTDQGMRNFDVASGCESAGPLSADLGVPSERSVRSVSSQDLSMADVSSLTDLKSVSHTSYTTKQDQIKQESISGLAVQAVQAGPDHTEPTNSTTSSTKPTVFHHRFHHGARVHSSVGSVGAH